jgi:glycosyltransferase involved in cell wall biosynthesis
MFLTQLSPLILPLLRRFPSLYHAVWYRAVCPLGTKLLPDGSPCGKPWGRACLAGGCLPARDWVPLMGQMWLSRRWRGAFDAVVANGEAVRRRLLEDGFTDVETIPNGVPARPPRPPLGDTPLVAFAGRLVREKGPQVLLEAFAGLAATRPDARLLIAGEGPLRGELQRRVTELRLDGRVELPGRLGRADLERRLEAAWVQAAPGLWEEPFGLAVAEAMMRGTAVVATEMGEPAELVREGVTGLRVPPGDRERLATALERLLSDKGLAERMGRAGRERALAELSEERWLDRFEELYARLTAAGSGRPAASDPRSAAGAGAGGRTRP